MLISIILCFFALLTVCLSKDDHPIEYTDDNFSTNINNHQTALVMFYAPWCGHCKRLKPEFAKAATFLIKNDPPIALIKVDCTDSGKATCKSFSISGYPTLKVFRNGEMAKTYSGPRDALGIVKYMKNEAAASVNEFQDLKEWEEQLKDARSIIILGVFDEDSTLKAIFFEAANKLRDKAKFFYTTTKEALEKYDTKEGVVILIRPQYLRNRFEESYLRYADEDPSSDGIKDFVLKNYHGLVGLRGEENRNDFKPPYVIAYYDIDYKLNPKSTQYWRNRILKVAQNYKDKLTFAISPLGEMNEFGDEDFDETPIIFAKNSKNEKFKMDDDFSVDALDKFVKDFLDNNLKQYVKSEDLDDDDPNNIDKDDRVLKVVAKNFEEMIIGSEKHVLLTFYSPWCGHCQKLMPILGDLSDIMENEDVLIAKMDATANDAPAPYKVDAYPTIYWIGKDGKNDPIQYEGGRKLDDFLQYISKSTGKMYKRRSKKKKPKKDEL